MQPVMHRTLVTQKDVETAQAQREQAIVEFRETLRAALATALEPDDAEYAAKKVEQLLPNRFAELAEEYATKFDEGVPGAVVGLPRNGPSVTPGRRNDVALIRVVYFDLIPLLKQPPHSSSGALFGQPRRVEVALRRYLNQGA